MKEPTCCYLAPIGQTLHRHVPNNHASRRSRAVSALFGCRARATVSILATRGTGVAGPDIYSDETESCDKHVGRLLGCQPDARDPKEIYWEVRTI